MVIVSPPGYPHSETFREVAETIHYGLRALGMDSVVTTRFGTGGRQHIVLGPHLLSLARAAAPRSAIFYNFELLSRRVPWFTPSVLQKFRRHSVWDYSARNVARWRRHGVVDARHVPLGYVAELSRIPRLAEDIDVLFYGSLNARRIRILERLRALGARTEAMFGVYGRLRDRAIARSKIVLNMHYYPGNAFEIVRVSYLLANRRFVISEQSSGEDARAFAKGVVFADYRDLVDVVWQYLSRGEERERVAQAGFAVMSARRECDLLREVLGTQPLGS